MQAKVFDAETAAETAFAADYVKLAHEYGDLLRVYADALVPTAQEMLERSMTPQGTGKWLQQRTGFVTASNAGGLLGLSVFSSYDMAVRKAYSGIDTLADVTDPRARAAARDRMDRGKRLEPVALDKFKEWMKTQPELKGMRVETAGLTHHAQYPIFAGSPDALVLNAEGMVVAVVEIKAPMRPHGKILAEYTAQMNLLMWIFNVRKCYFVQLLRNGSDDSQGHHLAPVVECAFKAASVLPDILRLARIWRDEIAPRRLMLNVKAIGYGDMWPASPAVLEEALQKPDLGVAARRAIETYMRRPGARYKTQTASAPPPPPAPPPTPPPPLEPVFDRVALSASSAAAGPSLSTDDLLLRAAVLHNPEETEVKNPDAKRAKVDGASAGRAQPAGARVQGDRLKAALLARGDRAGKAAVVANPFAAAARARDPRPPGQVLSGAQIDAALDFLVLGRQSLHP